ncbi:hypothetical protein PybrP1_003371 [[Pythium] brassicae (nom. inval.)]|nr:hypothetical protein PybrP1_003371 [[Pythium] brassicae (nom. inval.)]
MKHSSCSSETREVRVAQPCHQPGGVMLDAKLVGHTHVTPSLANLDELMQLIAGERDQTGCRRGVFFRAPHLRHRQDQDASCCGEARAQGSVR